MRIRELLKKEGIALGVKVDSKDAAIDYLIDLHAKSGNITDKAEFKKGILAREESGSTGVGEESQFLIPRMQQLSSRDLQL